jgi:glutamate-1-semialdehyde 2,1-aminomutase
VAAVAVAASYDTTEQGAEFYPALRKLTEEKGALLVFDEIVTGFRVALGGVQEHFGVTPDMAVFAKGMANGMPLSVYCGRRDVMEMATTATISSTYGGETLSLAAARAAITTYREENVIAHLWRQGEKLWGGLNELFAKHGLPAEMKGFWCCPRMVFGPDAPSGLSDDFMRACYRNGISMYNVGYVNFSHKDADVAECLERFDKVCAEVAAG